MSKQVIYEDGMSMLDVQATNPQELIETEDKYRQALSFLFGWFAPKRRWKPILSDADGRLLVSSSETKSGVGEHSAPEISAVSAVMLPANVNRKLMIIQNFNDFDVFLSFDGGDATAVAFILQSGASYVDNVYYGKVTGRTATDTGSLNITELT